MAIRRQREVVARTVAASGTITAPVGNPSIPPGAVLVAFMTKSVYHGPASITDTKGNTWIHQGEDQEVIDTSSLAVLTCVVDTELLPADIFTFDHQPAFSEKSYQIHEFRAAGDLSVIGYAGSHSTFPHDQPHSAGSQACVAGDASIGAVLELANPVVSFLPKEGYIPLSNLDTGVNVVYSEYGIMIGTTAHPTVTSSASFSNTGGSIVLRAAAPTGIPINLGVPVLIADAVESGQPFACSTGWWRPGGDDYTFQWKRDTVAIPGITTEEYTPRQPDVGKLLSCTVTATNIFGSASATSPPLRIAQGPPPDAPKAFMLAFSHGWEARPVRYPRDGGWT